MEDLDQSVGVEAEGLWLDFGDALTGSTSAPTSPARSPTSQASPSPWPKRGRSWVLTHPRPARLLSDKKDLKNSDLEGVILFEEVAAAIEEGKHGEERERERERERVRAQRER